MKHGHTDYSRLGCGAMLDARADACTRKHQASLDMLMFIEMKAKCREHGVRGMAAIYVVRVMIFRWNFG